MDKVAEIKRLYLNATRATIATDIERAIALLKSIESEEDRERAAVFMDGLSQMRSEWGQVGRTVTYEKPRPAGSSSTRRG
jgi:hypothetical protein